jgi:hypothetical protein
MRAGVASGLLTQEQGVMPTVPHPGHEPAVAVLSSERDVYLRQRDEALGERNEMLRQRDEAIGERNELRRQLEEAIGERNLQTDRVARYVHRADMLAQRGRFGPLAGTRGRILLFLHLAKTGGVTLTNIFARNLEIKDFLMLDMTEINQSSTGTWSLDAVDKALGRMPNARVDELRFVWGHFGPCVQSRLPRPCAIVTMLRDPVDRVVSAVYYDVIENSGGALEHYLASQPYLQIFLDNYMTRVLSGIPELDPFQKDTSIENHRCVNEADLASAMTTIDNCLVVGLTDRFDETLLVLGSALQWSLSDLVYERLNTTKGRPALADIAPATRERLLRWNGCDAALVSHARTHLAQRIGAYPGDFERDLMLFRHLNSLFQMGTPLEELRRMEYELAALPSNCSVE